MRQRRAQGLPLVYAQHNADVVLRVRIQLCHRPAEQQGHHGAGASVVIQIKPHKLGFGYGYAVNGVPVILLQPGAGGQVQRVGQLPVLTLLRQVGSDRRRVLPLLRGDLIPARRMPSSFSRMPYLSAQ